MVTWPSTSARATPEAFLLNGQGTLVFHGGLHDDAARKALEAAIGSLLRKQPMVATSYAVKGTSLERPAPPRQINDPYGVISFSSELIFEKIPSAAAHHCSTICEAGDGDLVCVWYGGSYESADDQVLFMARKKPADKNWSTPRVLVRNALEPPGNAVVFRGTGHQLWIVWARMESSRPMRRGSGWDRCRLMFRTSTDDGATWNEDQPMLADTVWCVPRNPPIALADGTMVLPVEGSLDGVEGSHFMRLAPGAIEWQRAGFTSGGSQPALAQRSDGSLLALLRHTRNIAEIESRDGGETWSQARPTTLKNPDSGISMRALANGHWVLVYNDSEVGRTPLSIVRSLDEGKTWEKSLQLESNPGEYSYPCIIQASDGRIHITYTFRRYAIKHVELNEDWLMHFERPD